MHEVCQEAQNGRQEPSSTTQGTVQVKEQRFNNQQRSNQVVIAWQTNPVGAGKGKVRNPKRQVKTQTGKIRIRITIIWQELREMDWYIY